MLTGLRVLDLSRVLAGPLCTMILADMGADVIKVERPDGGDETRGWGPPFAPDGASAYFLSVNRNKLSIGVDLAVSTDLDLLLRLAREADVVVENFLPGTLERRGWGATIARAERPELVWCSISGFGGGSRRPGYDFVVQAESGWMSITGTPDGEPESRRGNGDDSVRMHGDPSFSKGFGKTGEQPAPALIGHSVSDSRQIRTAVPKETNNKYTTDDATAKKLQAAVEELGAKAPVRSGEAAGAGGRASRAIPGVPEADDRAHRPGGSEVARRR